MRSKANREFGFRQTHGGREKFPGGEWGKSAEYGRTSEFRESDSYDRDRERQRELSKEDDRWEKPVGPVSEDFIDEHSSRSRFSEPYTGGQFARSQYGMGGNYSRDYGMWNMNFSGRGPKGYTRSDDRIREDVCETLYLHPLVDASDIEVKVLEGHVTLSGTVDSREAKREAEKSIEHISGVIDVFNELRLQKNIHESGKGH